jgi:hypothetical protein
MRQENVVMTIHKKHLSLTLVVVVLASMAALVFAPLAGAASAPVVLSPEEIADLQFMREEEKLARDVYQVLYEEWDQQIFTNIADSEQTHMDAMLTLLNRYDIDDPVAGNAAGEFDNPELQDLYDQLVDLGSQSLVDALRVGTAIEEIDIRDLVEAIDETDHADIERVYQSLKRGSENHLRAFVRTLERQTGDTFEPQYLDQDTYDEIMAGRGGYGGGNGAGIGNSNGAGNGAGIGNSNGGGNSAGNGDGRGRGGRNRSGR